MEFVCKIYDPNKSIVQIFPTCRSGDHFLSSSFQYGELVKCGNQLETSKSIKEVILGFLNPKTNPNSSYQKPSRMGGKDSLFH